MVLIRYSCGHISGHHEPIMSNLVCEGFHHVLLKYGHKNAEMQKWKFDDVTLRYSTVCNSRFVIPSVGKHWDSAIQDAQAGPVSMYTCTRKSMWKKHRSFVGFAMRTEVIYINIGCQNNKYNSFSWPITNYPLQIYISLTDNARCLDFWGHHSALYWNSWRRQAWGDHSTYFLVRMLITKNIKKGSDFCLVVSTTF